MALDGCDGSEQGTLQAFCEQDTEFTLLTKVKHNKNILVFLDFWLGSKLTLGRLIQTKCSTVKLRIDSSTSIKYISWPTSDLNVVAVQM